MSPNPLTSVSMRAARWSATHPWRAIFGWLALIVVAVGLAATVSTEEASDADYRLGESGVADQVGPRGRPRRRPSPKRSW